MTEHRVGAMVSGWTLVGVAAVLSSAVYRLGTRGVEAIQGGLDGIQWMVLILLTVGFVYGEGVLTLERKWIPRVVERSRRLREQNVILWLLAPLYGLSLVGTEWKELLRGWLMTSAIVVMVLIVRGFPAPWRGIVDFAVAAALCWAIFGLLRRVPAAVR